MASDPTHTSDRLQRYCEQEEDASQQAEDILGVPTVFLCGARCEHAWDGPEVAWGNGASITCSKCGALAGDEAMWGDC